MALRAAAASSAAAVLLCATAAQADVTAVCLSSYEQAQVARKEARLRHAREQLLLCSQAGCPGATRADCVPWLAEVEKALPSVVITAKDAGGRELVDVGVSFDGAPLASRLDGRSLAIDPGEHTFRLEAAGHPPLEQRVVIHEAEKARPLAFSFPWSAVTPRPAPPASHAAATASAGLPSLHPGPAVYALGAVSLVALGSFVYFGLTGTHDANGLRDACYPHCAASDVSNANRELLVADVSLGIAVVAAGVATYLLLTSHEPTSRVTAGTVGFAF
jgi:hypothetical protein